VEDRNDMLEKNQEKADMEEDRMMFFIGSKIRQI
jgi:hypothetical protein